MNLNLNPTSYQEVAYFYAGEGRGPQPNPHSRVSYCFKFCVIDTLPMFVNLLYLFTLFDTHAHKNKQHHCAGYMVHLNAKQKQTTNNGSQCTLLKTTEQ